MSNSNIDDLFPCISCGVNADPADGFGKCTCGNEAKREAIQQELLKARINSLLDLEQWIKLHDLGQEMILDGIEHMVKSNLQVPDQPRINHDDRIADLQAKLMDTTRESE